MSVTNQHNQRLLNLYRDVQLCKHAGEKHLTQERGLDSLLSVPYRVFSIRLTSTGGRIVRETLIRLFTSKTDILSMKLCYEVSLR